MPNPHPRSCDQCRKSKTRCDLSAPCVRCKKRGLDCRYSRPSHNHDHATKGRKFRTLKPAGERSCASASEDSVIVPQPAVCSSRPTRDGAGPHRQAFYTGDTELHRPPPTSETSSVPQLQISSDFMPRAFDLPDSFDLPPFLFNLDMPLWTSNTVPAGKQLEQRSRSFQQGAMTAKLLFSKLASYSRVMADAKRLPPFVYPACWSETNGRCNVESTHRCLPETLAVCSNLTQMFCFRRNGSEGFVWQQICAHLKQLRDTCDDLGDEQAVHAMQCALVYGILCATDVDRVARADAEWVVSSIETLGKKAFSACAWALSSTHTCSSRHEWILMESLRRIGCTLYLFDLLIQSTARTPSKGDCETFWFMPLPCNSALWQPMPDARWCELYHEDLETRRRKDWQGLTLRHLLLFRQAKITGDSIAFQDELAEWCEHVDDLSTLLWLALTVEGDGQSVMSC